MFEQVESSANPFPGLRPFQTEEYDRFFGRDGQSEGLVNKLQINRFVAVVGTSGSGKSSLVRAGLLPALYSGHMRGAGSSWRIAIFRPQDDPVGNLALALCDAGVFAPGEAESAIATLTDIETTLGRSSLGLVEAARQARMLPHENLLIVVDQFEELFRFKQASTDGAAADEKAAFVKLLLEAIKQDELPIYVALTMRSDYLGECAQFRDLPEAINRSQYLIPRMTDDERREAITGPVKVGGGDISSPLVNRLLNDVGDNPDQLPILQHALMRTWDYWSRTRRGSEPIDLPHYEGIGGMTKALSLDADKAYEMLSESQKKTAERIFKRLTEKGADNREVRRPTSVRELCDVTGVDEKEVFAVIEAFQSEGRCFLTAQDNVIDISHESLIRGWDRLKIWVEEEAQSARIYRRLVESAIDYGFNRTGLITDPALQFALEWFDQERPNKAWAERYHPEFGKAVTYLEASKSAREWAAAEKEREEREKIELAQARAEQEAKSARRLRRLVAALIVMFLLASGIAAFAGIQWTKANTEKDRANRQTEIAEDQEREAKRAESEAMIARANAERAEIHLQKAYNELKDTQQIAEQRARAIGEARLNAIQKLGKLYGEAFDYLVDKNDPDGKTLSKALVSLEEVLEIYRQNAVPSGQISTLALLSDIGLKKKVDRAKQIEYDVKLLEVLPDKEPAKKIPVLLRIGNLYRSSTDKEDKVKAAWYYEEYLRLGGSDFLVDEEDSVSWRIGDIYAQSNDAKVRKKSIANYKAAIEAIKEVIELMRTKAKTFTVADDYVQYRLVTEKLPDMRESLGTIYAVSGEDSEAEKLFIEARPGGATTREYISISWRVLELNNTEKAAQYFEKAIDSYSTANKVSKGEAVEIIFDWMNAYAYPGSLFYCNHALNLARKLNDSDLQAKLIQWRAGWIEWASKFKTDYSRHQINEVLKYLELALKDYERLNNTEVQERLRALIKKYQEAQNKRPQ
ncbi:MAG TPA: hypothetical protein VF131_27305 [Blastocatellia bacterium]|nr:hypothetical protein [Blastocatellia bacterium]